MKKSITFLLILLCSGLINGQLPFMPKLSSPETEVQHFTTAEYDQLANLKSTRSIIWSEDFGGGAIPADWYIWETTSLAYNFIWSNSPVPGPNGQFVASTLPFMSSSVGNGYLCMPSDEYNTPNSPSYIDIDAYAMLPVMNFDTIASAMIVFEQYFRYCCSSTPGLYVEVSNDSLTWTRFDMTLNTAQNSASPNPDVVTINISSVVSYQPTVYIRFYQTSLSHYYWAIDDIHIESGGLNDLKMNEFYLSNLQIDNNVQSYLGAYSWIPQNQFTPVAAITEIRNIGGAAQTKIGFTSTYTNSAGNLIHTENDSLQLLDVDSIDILQIPTPFYTSLTDTFEVEVSVEQAETDDYTANNTLPAARFNTNNDRIYARDFYNNTYVSTSLYTGASDGDFVGLNYFIQAPDEAASISIYINPNTDPGGIVIGQLYERDQSGSTILQIESEEHVILATELDTWIDLPLFTIDPTDDDLLANTTYVAGIECYGGGIADIFIGGDNLGPHLYHLATNLRIGQDWYWISDLPLIRLNLDGSIVQPLITTTPLTEVYIHASYYYNVSAFDPGGFPLTLTAYCSEPGINMSANDNGNGTMTISTPQISGTSFTGDEFEIIVTADNGVAKTHQPFVVFVKTLLEEPELASLAFKLYPNPGRDKCYLELPEISKQVDIEVYSILGAELMKVERNNVNKVEIDVSNLAQGLYIIHVVADGQSATKNMLRM